MLSCPSYFKNQNGLFWSKFCPCCFRNFGQICIQVAQFSQDFLAFYQLVHEKFQELITDFSVNLKLSQVRIRDAYLKILIKKKTIKKIKWKKKKTIKHFFFIKKCFYLNKKKKKKKNMFFYNTCFIHVAKAAPTRASNLCKLVCTNCLTTATDGTSIIEACFGERCLCLSNLQGCATVVQPCRLLKLRCEFF